MLSPRDVNMLKSGPPRSNDNRTAALSCQLRRARLGIGRLKLTQFPIYAGIAGVPQGDEARSREATRMTTTRIDLAVPYSRKEEAKALGARWDGGQRTGTHLRGPTSGTSTGVGCRRDASPTRRRDRTDISESDAEPEKGIALTDLLAQVKGVIEQGHARAVWVRAEISELRGKNGHLYPTLTERNERGDVLAQCKGGHLEEPGRPPSPPSSSEATGEGLKTDIKILCLAKVRFDPLYGLDLIIEDVDPSYTLGDLAAKLARIRERLVKERPLRAEQGPARPGRVRPGRRHQPRDLGGPGRLPPGDRPAPATPGSASSSTSARPSRGSTPRPRSAPPSTRPSPPTGSGRSTPWSSSGAAAP